MFLAGCMLCNLHTENLVYATVKILLTLISHRIKQVHVLISVTATCSTQKCRATEPGKVRAVI